MTEQNELLLLERCQKSKGTSAQHIYAKIEKLLIKKLDSNSKILDLGSGIGFFKKFLMKKNQFYIEEADFTFVGKSENRYQINLNEKFELNLRYDAVSIIEVLHFMENPRHLLRQAHHHLVEGGSLIVSIPNLHSLTSQLSFLFRGMHSAFTDKNYPAHITPIHKIDMIRMLNELSMKDIEAVSCKLGRIPSMGICWQNLFPGSAKIFRSSWFSDNIIFIAKK